MRTESCRIVELRRYALQPGARETLIELFDREFVETQEEVGMCVLGQFRDLDDPDSFVWLRGFDDMERRRRALEDFYGGPVWKAHSREANATMIDSGNVLLLRPVSPLALDTRDRPRPANTAEQHGLVAVTICRLAEAQADEFEAFFASEVEPAVRDAGIDVLGTYATEHSENTFPALPVREDGDVFVWLAAFADEAHHAQSVATLERSSPASAGQLDGEPEVLRLTPTARSLLHG
jgi:quinol monooxygenase YgiN